MAKQKDHKIGKVGHMRNGQTAWELITQAEAILAIKSDPQYAQRSNASIVWNLNRHGEFFIETPSGKFWVMVKEAGRN